MTFLSEARLGSCFTDPRFVLSEAATEPELGSPQAEPRELREFLGYFKTAWLSRSCPRLVLLLDLCYVEFYSEGKPIKLRPKPPNSRWKRTTADRSDLSLVI